VSFTARVKDELSRIDGSCDECAYVELSAIMRICGTLSLQGDGTYFMRMSTERGAVARVMIKLIHGLFGLDTPMNMLRRTNLQKTRNYLIDIPDQGRLEGVLSRLGIIVPGHGQQTGIPVQLMSRRCCRQAFVRGAFMAGGFIADPTRDFHLEIALTEEGLAQGIADLLVPFGIDARINHRRGSSVLYVKSFDEIVSLLRLMGAELSVRTVESARRMKSLKNEVNRRVNAELANQARSIGAAADQLRLIEDAERLVGFRNLPNALKEFCLTRRRNPTISLAQLGRLFDPPASKSAMYHRALRLERLVDEALDETHSQTRGDVRPGDLSRP
jgi:hypothetical protein